MPCAVKASFKTTVQIFSPLQLKTAQVKRFRLAKKIFYPPYVAEGKSQLAQNVYEEGKTILQLEWPNG
jgi:hypothetical protein